MSACSFYRRLAGRDVMLVSENACFCPGSLLDFIFFSLKMKVMQKLGFFFIFILQGHVHFFCKYSLNLALKCVTLSVKGKYNMITVMSFTQHCISPVSSLTGSLRVHTECGRVLGMV